MDPREQLKSFKAKISSVINRDKQGLTIPAYRDWAIMVIAFFLFSFLAAGVGFYLFLRVNSGEIFVVENRDISLRQTIDQAILDEVIEVYGAKEETLEELLSKRPHVIDPSR